MARLRTGSHSTLFLLLLALAPSRSLAAELCVSGFETAGSGFEVPVVVGEAEDVAGFQFCLTYDCAVLGCAEVAGGGATSEWTLLSGPGTASCEVCVVGVSPTLTPLPAGEQKLAEVRCVSAGASGRRTELCVEATVLADETGEAIHATTCGCRTITVAAPSASTSALAALATSGALRAGRRRRASGSVPRSE